MALKIFVTRRAGADIISIRAFLLEREPHAAEKVRLAINRALVLVARHPHAGRNRPELEARSVHVVQYPYTIYYRADDATLSVVHVRDDRRQFPKQL